MFAELNVLRYDIINGYDGETDRCAINLNNVMAIIERKKGGCQIIGINGATYEFKENYDEVLETVKQAKV